MSYRLDLPLQGRLVVVCGGGPAAARRAAACAEAGAEVLVVAEHACEDLTDLVAAGRIRWRPREWRPTDLAEAWLVHAATGSAAEDAAVAAAAERARVWCIAEERRRPANADGVGRVWLVGGGPGNPELLTVRGRELIQQADVLVVDRLAPWPALADLDADVEIVDVGKSPDHHPVPQDEINRLLVEHARQGRRVVRLKGGDPYLLGRGGEEAAACRAAGVPVTVVPGVTSAFAVPAAAGIPVTHRGLSRSVTVLTGHEELSPQRLRALRELGGTIVVLMGVATLGRLVPGLLAAGMPGSTPVAIVERGWTADQRVTTAPLAGITAAAEAAGVRAPAVIVIGAVAALAESLPEHLAEPSADSTPEQLTEPSAESARGAGE